MNNQFRTTLSSVKSVKKNWNKMFGKLLKREAKTLEPFSKFSALQNLLETYHTTESVVIFSKYATTLQLLHIVMRTTKWQTAFHGRQLWLITGKTENKQHQNYLDQIYSDKTPFILLMTIKTGALGLSLTTASVSIILDPQWNPTVEEQAQDRIHRIGQTKPTTVYRFISDSSVDIQIVKKQVQKKHKTDSIFELQPQFTDAPEASDLLQIMNAIALRFQ